MASSEIVQGAVDVCSTSLSLLAIIGRTQSAFSFFPLAGTWQNT